MKTKVLIFLIGMAFCLSSCGVWDLSCPPYYELPPYATAPPPPRHHHYYYRQAPPPPRPHSKPKPQAKPKREYSKGRSSYGR